MHVPISSSRSDRNSAVVDNKTCHLGYCYIRSEGGSYVGGLLVVTETGCPVAFHYTRPIRPNDMQRVLYGAALDRAISGDLITRSLLDATKQALRCLFVSSPACLGVRPSSPFPVVYPVAEHDEVELLPKVNVVAAANSKWLVHAGYESDAAPLAELLERVGGREVLLEPFTRIRTALEELQKQAA